MFTVRIQLTMILAASKAIIDAAVHDVGVTRGLPQKVKMMVKLCTDGGVGGQTQLSLRIRISRTMEHVVHALIPTLIGLFG